VQYEFIVYEQKWTAIVSRDRGKCFILPLNFKFVTPLREFYQLVRNIEVHLYFILYFL